MGKKFHKDWSYLFPMTIKGISCNSFWAMDKAFGLPRGTVYFRYVSRGIRGDDLVAKAIHSIDLKKIFPMKVCGKKYASFTDIDRAFGLKKGVTRNRYVEHGWRGDKLGQKSQSWAHLFPMTVCGRVFSRFIDIDRAFDLPTNTSLGRYVKYGMRGDELAKKANHSVDKKKIFPMTVCGRVFNSFRSIDAAFGLTTGRSYQRYVRNGLRGDELGRTAKKHDDILAKVITIGGVKKTVREWIKENGICTKTFYHRFYEMKWDIKDCIKVAVGITTGRNHTTGRYVTWNGMSYRTIEFARLCGLTLHTVLMRLNNGWTPQQIHDRPADCTVRYVQPTNRLREKRNQAALLGIAL